MEQIGRRALQSGVQAALDLEVQAVQLVDARHTEQAPDVFPVLPPSTRTGRPTSLAT